MADSNTQPPQQKEVNLQKIFVADASLEVPKAPEIFTRKWEPKIDLQINTSVKGVQGGESQMVILTVTATANLGDDVAYIAEVQQAGVVALKGMSGEEETRAVLGAYVPQTLFPYAREAISDLVQRGGFPQFLIQPVNFDAVYQQHVAQNQPVSETKH